MSVTNREAPGEERERAFAKPKKHEINALITLFLDSSQTVTQLTPQQAVGVEAACHTTGDKSHSSTPALLSREDGPGQVWEDSNPPSRLQPSQGTPAAPWRARQTAG